MILFPSAPSQTVSGSRRLERHSILQYITCWLPSKKTKMADGNQENSKNSADPETTEGDSNDAEEADEVHNILFVVIAAVLLFVINSVKSSASSSFNALILTLYSFPNISLNQDLQVDLDLGELDLTSQDEFILDEVDGELNKKSASQKVQSRTWILGFLEQTLIS